MERYRIFFRKVVNFLKNIIFPIFCLSCQTEGYWVCPDCLAKVKREIQPQFFCPHCYQDNEDGRTCLACRPFSFLDGLFSLSSYSNEIIAKMIQLLKYDYVKEMAEVFVFLIDDFSKAGAGLKGCPLLKKEGIKGWLEFVILPVPLHRSRYLERGFNQAELIARVWAKHLSLPTLKNVLVRPRPTMTQVGLGRAERQKNLVGAFKLRRPLENSPVILIDDVFTTGSTLQECARVLKEGGAREVWGMTVAREL